VIESCGVPHPEVDLILVEGVPVKFDFVLDQSADVDVYGTQSRSALLPKERLQSGSIQKFIADGHLGKLATNLRLLGLDVAYDRHAQDRQLLEPMTSEDRALLTRDRRLLMHKIVQHGYYPRSQNPFEQTLEIVRRFDLRDELKPFMRCLHCNRALDFVTKADVLDQLEPLTKIYYDEFRRCAGCVRIYWRGSHFDRLRARVDDIRAALE
jgi:uncharacterized protein with PIN domain